MMMTMKTMKMKMEIVDEDEKQSYDIDDYE